MTLAKELFELEEKKKTFLNNPEKAQIIIRIVN